VVAHIHERLCVGCTKCFKRCPTDAIIGAIGANDQIHVVFEDACTGCGKCVDACPTECIELRPPTLTLTNWVWPVPEAA